MYMCSPWRALTLPDVPWLIRRAFIARAASTMARRSACFECPVPVFPISRREHGFAGRSRRQSSLRRTFYSLAQLELREAIAGGNIAYSPPHFPCGCCRSAVPVVSNFGRRRCDPPEDFAPVSRKLRRGG